MLYNINRLSLHCVFHGIRFKVNKDWLSGIDSLLFLYPLHLFFHDQISSFLRIYAIFIPFLSNYLSTYSTKILYLQGL
ncbi:hypothetical protein GA421_16910 [Bacteroides xylanisolvens]|uniref:Uncharacterized protein n=1 Tax=Bacteroides xylanisolvens TaxID=371601 RepID=A0A6A2RNK3_9BACE|nr:hypothetical protein GA406_15795 [Bacteroides xylanisolvens]KAB6114957.1 hypothetical protein GA431_16525 [Bacteroides xylanisolvens]KAB6119148.1 hypothetical protein GA439_16440 [Bacteroides xylanisolvens]KAB6125839.1 hypothetical protein GA432_16195 [Bacteroides xylanisolvens]KAB6131890.1 hypothetical protein GA410_15460 [Bacteroides xylanisolvens]